jgi:hypothetical protein
MITFLRGGDYSTITAWPTPGANSRCRRSQMPPTRPDLAAGSARRRTARSTLASQGEVRPRPPRNTGRPADRAGRLLDAAGRGRTIIRLRQRRPHNAGRRARTPHISRRARSVSWRSSPRVCVTPRSRIDCICRSGPSTTTYRPSSATSLARPERAVFSPASCTWRAPTLRFGTHGSHPPVCLTLWLRHTYIG